MIISHKLAMQKLADGYGNTRWTWLGNASKKNYDLQLGALKEDDKILRALFSDSDLLGAQENFSQVLAKKKGELSSKLSYVGMSQLDQYVIATKKDLGEAATAWGNFHTQQEAALKAGQKGVKGLGASFKDLGKNILAMGVNMAAFAAVTFVIQTVAKAIDYAVRSSERAIEAAEKMKESWSELDENQKKAEDTVAESGKRFYELSKGVDNEGNNLSLTSEQYEEYISLSNELAGIFPSMVQGFNAQGDAILNTTGGLEGLNEQLRELQRNTRKQKLDLLSKKDSETNKTGAEGLVAKLFSGDKGSYTRLQGLKEAQEILTGAPEWNKDRPGQKLNVLSANNTPWQSAMRNVSGFVEAFSYASQLMEADIYRNNAEVAAAVNKLNAELADIGNGHYQLEGDDYNKKWAADHIAEYLAAVKKVVLEQITKQQSLVDTDVKGFQDVARIVLDEALDAGGDAHWGGGTLAGLGLGDTLTNALYRTVSHLPAEMFAEVKDGEGLSDLLNDWVAEIANNSDYRDNLETLSQVQTDYLKGDATAGELQKAIDQMSGMKFDEDSLIGQYIAEIIETYRDSRLESVRNALAEDLGLKTPEEKALLDSLTEKQVTGITGMMGESGALEKAAGGKSGAEGFRAITSEIDRVNAYNDSISSLNETYVAFVENRKTVAELLNKDTLASEDYDAIKQAGYGDAVQFNPLTGGYEMNYQQYRDISSRKATEQIEKAQQARIDSQEEYNIYASSGAFNCHKSTEGDIVTDTTGYITIGEMPLYEGAKKCKAVVGVQEIAQQV